PGNANYTVNVNLTDKDGLSAPLATASILVNNVAPTVPAVVNRTGAANAPITLNGTKAIDPGLGDSISYLWTFVSASNAHFVPNAFTQNLTFVPASAGTYTFVYSATDSDGATSNLSTSVVTIQGNTGTFLAFNSVTATP